MNEVDWLASDSPQAMLDFLQAVKVPPDYRNHATPRKLRLFACAIWRQYHARWTGTSTPADYLAVLMEQIVWAEARADGYWPAVAHGDERWPLLHADAAFAATDSVNRFATATEARQVMASLLRDIVGNPFRPVLLPRGESRVCWSCRGYGNHLGAGPDRGNPECDTCKGTGRLPGECPWLTPTVLAIAGATYDERAGRECGTCRGRGWYTAGDGDNGSTHEKCDTCHGTGRTNDGTLEADRLAILADALEDAGCDNDDLLMHLRGQDWFDVDPDYQPGRRVRRKLRNPPPHVRGCWALDLILGKS